jgi:hypothetical protein
LSHFYLKYLMLLMSQMMLMKLKYHWHQKYH